MENDPTITEELTAYLDGELAPTEALRVEQRLGSDPSYRAEMQALQKTWDLFDGLPISQPGVSFTKTTMELVVDDTLKQTKKKTKSSWTWPLRIVVLLLIPALMFVVAFVVTRRVQMQPNLQLANNLLVIENFERYEKVDKDIQFLEALNERALFSSRDIGLYSSGTAPISADLFADTESASSPNSWESIDERMEWIENLDIEQKNELRRKTNEFAKLTVQQQEALKQFHKQLFEHPEKDNLIQVMNLFYDWLKTLGLSEQARLLDLQPMKARLNEIAGIRSRQAREAFGKVGSTALPTTRDAETLYDWYEMTLSSKERQIRQQFAGVLSTYFRNNSIPFKRTDMERFAYRRPVKQLVATLIGVDREFVQDLMLENVDLLRSALSFEARAILDEQSTEEQKELIFNWFEVANETRSSISPEQLQSFYEQLPVSDRDELDKMDPENWFRTLEERYRAKYRNSRVRDPIGWQQDWKSLLEIYGISEF